MRQLALIAGLLIALAGCGDATGSSDAVSGRWSGGDFELSLSVLIARDGSDVTGSGNITLLGSSSSLTVVGTWVAPNISLILQVSGFQDTNFTGTLHRGVIEGELNGSGFNGYEMTLVRE